VNIRELLRPRPIVLMLMWLLPTLCYLTIGIIALYETGWLRFVAFTLPVVWIITWSIARFWPPTSSKAVADSQRLAPQSHWTPQDIAAIAVVEEYRDQVAPIQFTDLARSDRYLQDVAELAQRLTTHYFQRPDDTVVGHITMVELLAVIHLAAADIEDWVAANVPGSKLVKIKTFTHAPKAAKSIEWAQNAIFLASAITNPARLASYPLWKMSGSVFAELRQELLQAIYQQFLRQIGFYLIEMYSGRLRGGSHLYEQHFRRTSQAIYELQEAPAVSSSDGSADVGSLDIADVSIAIMGQVKAGKSSLLNHLLRAQKAVTSVMPETREVSSHTLDIPGISARVRLLDTPGYSEDGAKQTQLDAIRLAAENSHILVLVLSAVSPARQADAELLAQLRQHYERQKHLQPPPILAVLTHIDQLSPRREWSPPYDWQHPKTAKEKSIAAAAAYVREALGPAVRDVVCVYTGEGAPSTAKETAGDKASFDNTVLDATIPAIASLLPEAQSAAVLCAYYRKLSEKRVREVINQIGALGTTFGRIVIKRLLST